MRKTFLIILLFLLTTFIPVYSETGKAGYAGAYLRFGLGARPLGMGGAFCAIADGIESPYYNPAGMALNPARQIGFTYHNLTLDRNLNSVAMVFPVRNQAAMALSWINSSVSDVVMRDTDRNPIGDFGNSHNSIALSFSKIIVDYFSVGANLRYIQSKLDELNAFTVVADIGGIFKYKRNIKVGLSVQNLGPDLRWDSSNYWGSGGKEYDDEFPVVFRIGGAGSFLDEAVITTVDVVKDTQLDFKIHAGCEYWLLKQVNVVLPDEEAEEEFEGATLKRKVFGIRTGYDDGSLTFGASLYYPYGRFHGGLDYAYMTGKRDEGSYHILTGRILF
ncbi:MAG: hypothetical protein B6D58_00740 [candidate division Zixibacteria bacterium 4484_95]|nr:MAG: hypothetical protein B6D58_00740 [candidate division Zixibacteria bacterium 4484_95]RKX19692.1 MAG: hypothetical protein DRP26_03005 [candidate division Zixibacteria bacterium]